MYNGIGLQTARGSGTNGYVQTNLSHLLFSRQREEYNAEADLAKNEAEITKGPNKELLMHEYKRRIEIKCVEFEDLMEEKGFDPQEVEEKVSEYRKLLLAEFEAGKMDLEKELDDRNSHSRAHLAKVGRDRFRNAMGIEEGYKAGSSFEKIRKVGDESEKKATEEVKKEEKEAEEKQAKIAQLMEEIKKEEKLAQLAKKVKKEQKDKKKKKRSRKESSSSSSSDSDSDDQRSHKKIKKEEKDRKKKRIRKESTSSASDSDEKQHQKRKRRN
jgi:serine/arginine repetitive matrix protein 2